MSRQELQLGLVPLPGRPDESMSNVTHADSARLTGAVVPRSRGRWSVLKICQCALRPGTQLDCSPIPVAVADYPLPSRRVPRSVRNYTIAIIAYPDTV